jgi:hypothetical protein
MGLFGSNGPPTANFVARVPIWQFFSGGFNKKYAEIKAMSLSMLISLPMFLDKDQDKDMLMDNRTWRKCPPPQKKKMLKFKKEKKWGWAKLENTVLISTVFLGGHFVTRTSLLFLKSA